MPEVPDLERGRLVGRPPCGFATPIAPSGRRVHDALDSRLQRLLEDDPRAAEVGREDRLAVGGAQRGPPGDVEDAVDAVHRPAHGAAVGDVAGDALELEPVEVVERRSCAGRAGAARRRARRARAARCEPRKPLAPGDQGRCHAGRTLQSAPEANRLIRQRGARAPPSSPTRPPICPTSWSPSTASTGSASTSPSTAIQRRESEIGATDYDDFYERLRRSEDGATTSQPSVGDFVAIYEPLLAERREIVSIHISAGISGTYESARQARQQLIDAAPEASGSTSGTAARLRRPGADGADRARAAAAARRAAAEALEQVERARETLKMWFAIDTLEYLREGGRIGAAQAWLGSALQIKPILTLEEEITPVERVRTRRRAFERMVEFARERKRRRRRRLGRPAHPRPRHGPAAGRRVPAGLRQRPGLRLRDRAGDRRPRRPRPARLRRDRRRRRSTERSAAS